MRIASRVSLGLAWSFVLALGFAAARADDASTPPDESLADETLALEQGEVDPAALEAQSVGTAPDAAGQSVELAVVPGAPDAPAFDQPSFASSQNSMTGGATSSSTLSATSAGGGVSLGQ
jgi:hypothetical protein